MDAQIPDSTKSTQVVKVAGNTFSFLDGKEGKLLFRPKTKGATPIIISWNYVKTDDRQVVSFDGYATSTSGASMDALKQAISKLPAKYLHSKSCKTTMAAFQQAPSSVNLNSADTFLVRKTEFSEVLKENGGFKQDLDRVFVSGDNIMFQLNGKIVIWGEEDIMSQPYVRVYKDGNKLITSATLENSKIIAVYQRGKEFFNGEIQVEIHPRISMFLYAFFSYPPVSGETKKTDPKAKPVVEEPAVEIIDDEPLAIDTAFTNVTVTESGDIIDRSHHIEPTGPVDPDTSVTDPFWNQEPEVYTSYVSDPIPIEISQSKRAYQDSLRRIEFVKDSIEQAAIQAQIDAQREKQRAEMERIAAENAKRDSILAARNAAKTEPEPDPVVEDYIEHEVLESDPIPGITTTVLDTSAMVDTTAVDSLAMEPEPEPDPATIADKELEAQDISSELSKLPARIKKDGRKKMGAWRMETHYGVFVLYENNRIEFSIAGEFTMVKIMDWESDKEPSEEMSKEELDLQEGEALQRGMNGYRYHILLDADGNPLPGPKSQNQIAGYDRFIIALESLGL